MFVLRTVIIIIIMARIEVVARRVRTENSCYVLYYNHMTYALLSPLHVCIALTDELRFRGVDLNIRIRLPLLLCRLLAVALPRLCARLSEFTTWHVH